MAIDIKAATPDTSLPVAGFLFGADSQAAAAPSIYSVSSVSETLFGGSQDVRADANSETWRAGREQRGALDHNISVEWDFWDSLKTGETIQGLAQDGSNTRVHVCWDTSRTGFAEAGILTEATLRTGAFRSHTNVALATTVNASVQMWVLRPDITLPSGSVSVQFTKVAAIGERALPDSQTDVRDHVTFTGLNIPVQAGDVLAYRVIGANIRYAENSGGTFEYAAAKSTTLSVADLDIDTAFSSPITGTSNGARRFFHKATIVKNDHYVAGNSPRGPLKLNATARIPAIISRDADNPWHGKKGCVLGSSISTYAGGGLSGDKGHIPMLMDMLQCDYDSFAVGGGYGLFPSVSIGSAVSQHISGTEAEFVSLFGGSDPGQYSYERRVLGQSYDFVIFPDLINDTNAGASLTIGAKGDTLPNTIWGAFSRMIKDIQDDNPTCQIFLQSPAHRWASYGGAGAPTEQANRILWTDALYEIADWFSLPEPIDYIRRGGINTNRVEAGDGLYDTIHPATGVKPQMARLAYSVMVRHGAGAMVL